MFRRLPEWIDAIAVIAFSAVIATRQGSQFKWFWAYPPVARATWIPLALTTVAAFFGAFQPVSSFQERKKRPDRQVWDRHLLYALGDLIARCQWLADQSKVAATGSAQPLTFDFGDLGLHVWKVAWHRRGEWPFYGRELERVEPSDSGRCLPCARSASIRVKVWLENAGN